MESVGVTNGDSLSQEQLIQDNNSIEHLQTNQQKRKPYMREYG